MITTVVLYSSETPLIATKWMVVLRSSATTDRADLIDLALSLLDVDEITRLVLDERVGYPQLEVADSPDISGLIHAYVPEGTGMPAEVLDLLTAGGADAYLMTESITNFAGEAHTGGEGENDGLWRLGFLRRRQDVSRERFIEVWRKEHSQMVGVHHPGTYQLRQAAVSEDLTRGAVQFDGIFQAYYPTLLDFRNRRFASDASIPLVMADLDRFVDQSLTELLFCHRTTLRGATPA